MSLAPARRALIGLRRQLGKRLAVGETRAFTRLVLQSGLFDPAWYVANNLDLAQSGIDPLHHFVHHGAIERRDPGPGFETDLYIENHPDWSDGFASPIEHYLRVGRDLGYVCRGAPPYERWILEHDALTPADEDRIAADAARSPVPGVTIVHVVDEAASAGIDALRAGLLSQIGVRWSARLVRGGSLADTAWRRCLAAAGDARIRCCEDADEAVATIEAGAIVVLCLGPVRLRPHAAYVLARTLRERGTRAAYADHDILAGPGTRTRPVFKPAPSPDYLKRVSYVGPVVALLADTATLRSALGRAGAHPGALDLAAIDDILLAREPREISRVPLILYHLLEGTGPDPFRPLAKAPDSAGGATPAVMPSVEIIIPTRDRVDLLRACVSSIQALTLYPADRLTITVVDNDSEQEETFAFFEEVTGPVAVARSPGRFDFARINNDAARASGSEVLVFLNNDTTVLRPDWLRTLVGACMEPGVGAVGAKLLYPDGTIQHGGVALGVQGVGAHRLVGRRPDEAGPLEATREMTSVTGACLAIRRELFLDMGGFDPVLQVAFNDVSLCCKLVEAGYRNLYVADPLLVHHESRSRGLDDTAWKRRRNAREAIYARTRFRALFQDDPSYSPNKSLQKVDDLAFPPRVVRPWRRSEPGGRRVLLLSRIHQRGHGVPVVLAQQAAYFRESGWDVTVGGPEAAMDLDYPGCGRVALTSARQAASYATMHGVDCVIAHTPPFFSVVRFLGADPPVYFTDHGEPNAEMFVERDAREEVNWEKRFCAPLARRVFTISQTIHDQQFRPDAIVVRNGNSHLALWSADWRERRERTRRAHGFGDRHVVLSVSRFNRDDRRYKGVDTYVEVANEFGFLFPALKDRVTFMIAGRGEADDVAMLRQEGLVVQPNPPDAQMQDLYAASDLYMSFSRWEGYNLGIGQALAMGLPVIASDIAAHREFPVFVSDSVVAACARLAAHVTGDPAVCRPREAFVEEWRVPLSRLESIIAGDVATSAGRWL